METNKDLLQRIKELEETIELLTFRQNLLFSNTSVDRALYEYDITKKQYNLIMDLMDKYRTKIDRKEQVSNGVFEGEMYDIVPQHSGNYHFVESLTRAFWENDRWEEVFDNLYRVLPKYQYLKKGF
ncbi:DUF1878 domain-containing protein [Bacillus thuringiensis]|uniref:DUF1878 domain-containing protein n=1 Tax=Bacillus cereus group TaxID=86661 RepID=UPI0007FB291B|nr:MULTISPECIES: DUF1878 domain-containing protein [Bacillus cereus group]MCP1399488.1 hypothetical protein [Bacillus cereus]OBW85187.1 DUF1878 domain-containing protein [Bacillus cereus]OBW85365.1 DUF1878 domain-containing protein [Bacillus cereus]PEA15240.1 DUF1878 domain-containing protein [Bacillus thuringiensis]PER53178.1 DUF1878 domain-containing protein [Bacillus thuringiensis]